MFINEGFGVAAIFYLDGPVGAGNFPRVAVAQPFVGDFDLPTVADLLVEDAEFVADAVA